MWRSAIYKKVSSLRDRKHAAEIINDCTIVFRSLCCVNGASTPIPNTCLEILKRQ